MNSILPLRIFFYTSHNFTGVKNATVGLDFRHQSSLSRPHFEMKKRNEFVRKYRVECSTAVMIDLYVQPKFGADRSKASEE